MDLRLRRGSKGTNPNINGYDCLRIFVHLCWMNSIQETKITLPNLNLPPFDPALRQKDGKLWIFDVLRKKHLVLTPEEWVRQHWINDLIEHLRFPRGLFSLERAMKYNQLTKRTDLIAFDRDAKPYLLIECKAPAVKIDQKTLNQAMTYNATLDCPNLILTNGLNHVFMSFSEAEGRFVQRQSPPENPK
jgi:hypothetical protein